MTNYISGMLDHGVQTQLYEKNGSWVTLCPSCGKEHDVGEETIKSGMFPVCCSWAFKLFDRSKNPPQYDPVWEYIEPLLKV